MHGIDSKLFGTCCLLEFAIALLEAAVHFFALTGAENVTFSLLKVLPFVVLNCYATSASRYCVLPLETMLFGLTLELDV